MMMAGGRAQPCRRCSRDRHSPCRNTRDMEESAIEGDDACLEALRREGGGERGIDNVLALRARHSAAHADRWAVALAEPHTDAVMNGRPILILEGPVWSGVAPIDLKVAEAALRWNGKVVVIPSGLMGDPARYLRGVVEAVFTDGQRLLAIVRHHCYGAYVRRTVDVRSLTEWPDPPPEPSINPVMAREMAGGPIA